jgi:hypothetical protein
MIRLKGQWLRAAGFHPGAKVTVTQVQAGVLEIRVCSPVSLSAESLEIMGIITEACARVDSVDSAERKEAA